MIRKFGKVGVLFLALVLALGGVGAAFSAWTDTITISGDVTTGVLEWEIDPGTQIQKPDDPDWNCFWDLETGTRAVDPERKNVANTTVVIEDATHPHSMTVTLDNAYPYYFDHIAFTVHGLGTIPMRIWKVNIWVGDDLIETLYANGYVLLNLDGKGGNDLQFWWGDNFGDQVHNSDRFNMSFELLVLQPAPQDQTDTLTFTIELVAIQWNEYTIPTPTPTPTP